MELIDCTGWHLCRPFADDSGGIQRSAEKCFRSVPEPGYDDAQIPAIPGDFRKNDRAVFKPFFGGVCLDPEIQASSNVFKYVLRVFAEGDVALPGQGMGAIAGQLAENFPNGMIRTGIRVESIHPGGVVLKSGQTLKSRAVMLATDGPQTLRLLGKPTSMVSHGELCLYFAAPKAPINTPYLILNGEGTGVINSLTVPTSSPPHTRQPAKS